MAASEYALRYYVAADGKSPFADWLRSLPDRQAAARVQMRLERLRVGNPGDVRGLGGGLSELRIDLGPGYRVFFIREGAAGILLLCAGDKSTQRGDIRRARQYRIDYRRRKDA